MRRLVAMAVALAALQPASAAAQPARMPVQTLEAASEACRVLTQEVDTSKLTFMAGSGEWEGEGTRFIHQYWAMRDGYRFPAERGAAVTLRFYRHLWTTGPLWDGMVIATRDAEGAWRLTRAPFDIPEQKIGVPRRWREGVASPEEAAMLDAALASPCLEQEPLRVDAEAPLKAGGKVRLCDDGFSYSYTLEVARAGRTRASYRTCDRYGLVGMVMEVLGRDAPEAWPEETFP